MKILAIKMQLNNDSDETKKTHNILQSMITMKMFETALTRIKDKIKLEVMKESKENC